MIKGGEWLAANPLLFWIKFIKFFHQKSVQIFAILSRKIKKILYNKTNNFKWNESG